MSVSSFHAKNTIRFDGALIYDYSHSKKIKKDLKHLK